MLDQLRGLAESPAVSVQWRALRESLNATRRKDAFAVRVHEEALTAAARAGRWDDAALSVAALLHVGDLYATNGRLNTKSAADVRLSIVFTRLMLLRLPRLACCCSRHGSPGRAKRVR